MVSREYSGQFGKLYFLLKFLTLKKTTGISENYFFKVPARINSSGGHIIK